MAVREARPVGGRRRAVIAGHLGRSARLICRGFAGSPWGAPSTQGPLRASTEGAASRIGAAGSRGVHDASRPGFACSIHGYKSTVESAAAAAAASRWSRTRHGACGGENGGALGYSRRPRPLRPGRDPGLQGNGAAESLRFPSPPGAPKNHERQGIAAGLLSWGIDEAIRPPKRAGRRVAAPDPPAIPRSKFCRNRGLWRITPAATSRVCHAGTCRKPRAGGARQRLRPIHEAAAPLPAPARATSGALRCIPSGRRCGVPEPHGEHFRPGGAGRALAAGVAASPNRIGGTGNPNKFNTRRGGAGL